MLCRRETRYYFLICRKYLKIQELKSQMKAVSFTDFLVSPVKIPGPQQKQRNRFIYFECVQTSDLVKVDLIYLLRHLNSLRNGHVAGKVKPNVPWLSL